MSTLPKQPKDLMLAPVAIEVDRNLQWLRDQPVNKVETALQLILDRPGRDHTRRGREERILEAALNNVDLHGWHAEITPDGTGLRLIGGSVSLELALGANVQDHLSRTDL